MKLFPIVAVVLTTLSLTAFGADEISDKEARAKQRESRILDSKAVRGAVKPHVDAMTECYRKSVKDVLATGDVRVELLIHRDGSVKKFKIIALGVKSKGFSKCASKLIKKWKFPERKGFTSAVVPFFFLKNNLSKAGPLESCWSQPAPAKTAPKKPAPKK
jgi:outer membrane biosynthesis protein TonB